jgi:hypothetical protein
MNKIVTGAAGVIFSALLLSTSAFAQTDCTGDACPKPGAEAGASAGADAGAAKQPAAKAGADASGQAKVKKPAAEGGTEAEGAAQSGETTGSTAAGETQEGTKATSESDATSKSDANATASANADVNVTVEQKTKIKQVVQEVNVEPVSVDFNISVGVAVPQTVVTVLRPVPTQIVEIVPAYAGYLFFMTASGQIVIVHPSTYEIVYVIV